MFIFNHDEKSGIITEQFDASTKSRLGINGQKIRIKKDDRFKWNSGTGLDIGFGEKFEFLTNKFNAFAVSTVYKHDIGFDLLFIPVIYFVEEIVNNGFFAGARRAMNNNMGYFIGFIKKIEFVLNIFMDR
jgi:hypothetical protein